MSKEMEDSQKILDGTAIDDTLLQEMYPKLVENGTVWTLENSRYEKIKDMMPSNQISLKR